ncbi:MAG: proton-conducting transporter membrane subunit [Pirellulales bacterium]
MKELHLPWLLELMIAIPFVSWIASIRIRLPQNVSPFALASSLLTLLCSVIAWIDFAYLHTYEAHDHWDFLSKVLGFNVLVIDELNAPLFPLASLIFFATFLVTLKSKASKFSFRTALLSQSITLATLACHSPWIVIVLLILGTLPLAWEIQNRKRSPRVFLFHMGLFGILLVVGMGLIQFSPEGSWHHVGVGLLGLAVLLRNGVAPIHCWLTDLFEKASFGSSLLFVTPMLGAYATMRLFVPVAPDWMLQWIAVMSLATAVYASGMALIQREARRMFCFLFLSHSSLVLVGLETATPLGLAGALCVWLSIGLAMTGFGLMLRCVESRTGRLRLDVHHGLFDHMPSLAAFFLLTGLASVGFPGTIGFIASELLVDSTVDVSPVGGTLLILSAALNGMCVMQAFFRIFTGTKHHASIPLTSQPSEKWAAALFAILIVGNGLVPQLGVESRFQAAIDLLEHRSATHGQENGSAKDASTESH